MPKFKSGLLALLSTCCHLQAAETPQFHAELLPPIDGAQFWGEKLNNLGHVGVTSWARDRWFQNYDALRLLPGTTTYQTIRLGMNDVDHIDDLDFIYGKYYSPEGISERIDGFFRNTGHTNNSSHSTPFTSYYLAANNSGFTLRSIWGSGVFNFVNWPMQPRSLVLPLQSPGSYFEVAVNQSGTIVGGESSSGKAFLWNPEKFIDLEALASGSGWTNFVATGINDNEYVIGTGKLNGQTNLSSVVWHAATGFQLLPSLGGDTAAASINNQNWIVGTSNGKGCLWVDGQIYDLNDLTPPSTNEIRGASQINEYGVIIASTWSTNIAPDTTIVYRQARRPALLQLTNLPAISATAASTNDNFASRTWLTGSASVVVAKNQSATAETSEPAHTGAAAEKSLWWTWQAPRNQTVEVNTLGSWINTRIAIYRGTDLSSLELVASNDNYGTNQVSLLRFNAQADEIYQIAVDSTGTGGKILLRVLPQFDAPKGAFAEAATIPSAGGVTTTSSILAATEKGEPDLPNTDQATLWFKWQSPITGKVALTPVERATNRALIFNLYTGNTLTNLTKVSTAATHSSGVTVFQVQAGQEYKVRTLESAAASGELQFELLHGINLEVGPSTLAGTHAVKLMGPYTQEYELQQSTNLVTWDTIQEGTIGSKNEAAFNLPNLGGSGAIFYRAIVKP